MMGKILFVEKKKTNLSSVISWTDHIPFKQEALTRSTGSGDKL